MTTWSSLINKFKKKYRLHSEVVRVMISNERNQYHPYPPPNINNDHAHLVYSHNKQTMSAPHIHASALNIMYDRFLDYSKGKKISGNFTFNVLDVGCGTGYVLACMASLIKIGHHKSIAVGIDIYKSLTNLTIKNISKNFNKIYHKKFVIECGNGWEGNVDNAPFQFIHVGAMADEIPVKLIEQLALNGKMVVPVNNKYLLITKLKNKKVKIENLYGVRFVKLINLANIKKQKVLFHDESKILCIDDLLFL